MPFDEKTLSRLARAEEVEIVTAGAQPVVIWVVLVGTGVYVRSVRGAKGNWYRHLVRDGVGELRVDRARLPIKATRIEDVTTIHAVSLALEQKYRDPDSLASMLRSNTLPTTLRLDPR